MNDPVLKQFVSLPDDWLYVRAAPEIKEQDGLKVNVAWTAPYTMVSNLANFAFMTDFEKNLKPEEIYNIYDESVILASYSIRKSKKNKNISDIAEEIFSIPQSDMQKALDELMPKLLNNEDLKKYAVLTGLIFLPMPTWREPGTTDCSACTSQKAIKLKPTQSPIWQTK